MNNIQISTKKKEEIIKPLPPSVATTTKVKGKEPEPKPRLEKEEEKNAYMFNELKFPNKGPLGLKLVPNTIPFTIESRSHNLLPGDEMVSINGEDVLNAENENEIMEVLIEASYPKLIKFRRLMPKKKKISAKTMYENKISKGKLIMTNPPILIDYTIDFSVAEFGVLRRIDLPLLNVLKKLNGTTATTVDNHDEANKCDSMFNSIQLRTVAPLEGCSKIRPLQRKVNDSYFDDSIIYGIVRRGVCSFTKKAELVEQAGYNGMIVFNGDGDDSTNGELMRMPAKRNFKTKALVPINFHGQALLISSMNGQLILSSIITGSNAKNALYIDGILKSNECPVHNRENHKRWMNVIDENNVLLRKKKDIQMMNENTDKFMIENNIETPDGYFYMWNGFSYSRKLPMALSEFGVKDMNVLSSLPPSRIVMGIPNDGCDENGFSNNVKGAWIIVKRGGCSFVEKAKIIQKVGGIVGIMLNTRRKPYLFEMPKGPDNNVNINIPFIMIPFDGENEIIFMKQLSENQNDDQGAGGHIIGRFHFL
jgi:hypothetical protein